jgi:cobalt transporter subunit CbtB
MEDLQAIQPAVPHSAVPHSNVRAWTRAGLWPAAGLLLFGCVILYFAGFSNLPQLHAAAHDTRHASGFPCH